MEKNIILWHRRDLRIKDNKALFQATKITRNVFPVFIIDPIFFTKDRIDCDDRILFMFECLEDLDEQYQKLGTKLTLLLGDSIDTLNNLSKNLNAKIFYNFDTNMQIGFTRDKKIKENTNFVGFNNDAILRNVTYNTRLNWDKNCKEYFEYPVLIPKTKLNKNLIESNTNINELIKRFQLKKTKIKVPIGGTSQAKIRLEKFSKQLDLYPKSISKPHLAELNTSRISAHISFGCLSTKQVYQYIKKYSSASNFAKNFFISRLFWNQHFTQKLEDFPDATHKPINPIFEENDFFKYDKNLSDAFFQAKTGFPIIDAAIVALKKTGFINFRSRAMLVSFYTLILRQPFKLGADWMHYHLIDADSAINYQQWQMQSGLIGIHPLRIYNPYKQLLEKDEHLKFIHEYLPIFKDIKDPQILINLKENEKLLNKKYKIKLGVDYPNEIVNFEEEMRFTRAFFKEKTQQIKEKLFIKEVLKRASLSNKRKTNSKIKESTKTKIKDKKLGDFFK